MKNAKRCLAAAFCGMAILFCGCLSTTATENQRTERSRSMEEVYQFLKEAGVYYIATVEGDQPRVRPFGTIHIFDGKLYIQTGKKKNVSKQLGINGKTELCAMKGDEWIRVSGTLVNDDRREAKVSMLDAYSTSVTPQQPSIPSIVLRLSFTSETVFRHHRKRAPRSGGNPRKRGAPFVSYTHSDLPAPVHAENRERGTRNRRRQE